MLPDVQQREPEIKIPLTKVGVNNVRKIVRVKREPGKRDIVLLGNIDCYVDLPAFQKGTHMSRNIEAINEIIEEVSKKPVYKIEDLCTDIVLAILNKHEYASYSEVTMKSRLMLHTKSPRGKPQQTFVNLFARALATRKNGIEVVREIGAEVDGIILHFAGNRSVCHMRAKAKLLVETRGEHEVKLWDILSILNSSLSSPTYSYLSEEEEAEVLERACSSPRTAREVVDEIIRKCSEVFSYLPEDTKFKASCRAKEPLFNFEIVDEKIAKLGELV